MTTDAQPLLLDDTFTRIIDTAGLEHSSGDFLETDEIRAVLLQSSAFDEFFADFLWNDEEARLVKEVLT